MRLLIGIVCGLFFGLFGETVQGFASEFAEKDVQIRTVALMPFDTFTVDGLSLDFTRFVTEKLKGHGLNVVPQDALEDFLAKRRIRRSDFLDRSTIRAMGTALNADALVMGTVNILSGGENPHVSVNAQMIECPNAAVMWANSVSRTGADYAGFLGLGRITSLEKLVDVVVGELFEDLPVQGGSSSTSAAPFEIVRASFFPDPLRSGETAQLSMEIKEIMGKVRDIRAFVVDREIGLHSRDGRFYGGTAAAPSIEGTYPVTVYITDRWNRLFQMDAVASLTVHNTPPRIILSRRQALLSPNHDGVRDFVLFVPEVLEAISLRSWKVEITDEEGRVVRSEKGVGELPQGFMWRGVNDQNKPVKDGTYYCRLIAEDEAGNQTAVFGDSVVVDATAPEVVVNFREENEEGVVLALDVRDMSEIDFWELVIFNDSGQEVDRFEGKGDLPETVTCSKKKSRTDLMMTCFC